MATQTLPHSRGFRRFLGRILCDPLRPQTYRNLCYLLVMLPLGIIYFNLLLIGFLTGIALVFVFIGVPIIVFLLALVVRLAGFERTLVRVLLRVDVPAPSIEIEDGLWERTKQLVTGRPTWKAVAYLLSVFVFATIASGLLASLGATAWSFLSAPLYYENVPVVAYAPIPSGDFTLDILFGWDNLLIGLTTTFRIGSWQIETLLGALLVASLGLVLLLFSFQVVNVLAWIWSRYVRVMLA
jgi:hypothetical protein